MLTNWFFLSSQFGGLEKDVQISDNKYYYYVEIQLGGAGGGLYVVDCPRNYWGGEKFSDILVKKRVVNQWNSLH